VTCKRSVENEYMDRPETNPDLVEAVAKAIAKSRMKRGDTLRGSPELGEEISEWSEEEFSAAFEKVWNGKTMLDAQQRRAYWCDAIAALIVIEMEWNNGKA